MKTRSVRRWLFPPSSPSKDLVRRGERACALSSWALASHSPKSAWGWTADKNAHVQWEQQVARRTMRIAQVVQRWIGWGRLKKRMAFTPKRRSKNCRNGNLGFDHPELT